MAAELGFPRHRHEHVSNNVLNVGIRPMLDVVNICRKIATDIKSTPSELQHGYIAVGVSYCHQSVVINVKPGKQRSEPGSLIFRPKVRDLAVFAPSRTDSIIRTKISG